MCVSERLAWSSILFGMLAVVINGECKICVMYLLAGDGCVADFTDIAAGSKQLVQSQVTHVLCEVQNLELCTFHVIRMNKDFIYDEVKLPENKTSLMSRRLQFEPRKYAYSGVAVVRRTKMTYYLII